MKIKLLNNTFFEITTINNYKLVCDPWLGQMNDTATWSYPNISSDKKILNKIKPNLIYISHLHTDHFDEKIIKNLKDKNTLFIIKKFRDGRLKKKINDLGIKNIRELNAWQSYKFNSFELTIIPCDSSTNKNYITDINYDLDTSILIYEKYSRTCFYNNVDNPCTDKILKKVKLFAKKKYNKINIASFAPRAASEFPQCFINLSGSKKLSYKKSIIAEKFNASLNKLKVIGANNYIPAGGNYVIYGKNYKLQKFVAHPTIKAMDDFFKNKVSYFNIDNSGFVEFKNGEIIKYYRSETKENNFKIPSNIKRKKYPHEILKKKEDLDKKFFKAKDNYLRICKMINIKKSWKINIFLYNNLIINNKYKLRHKNKYLKKYQINWNSKEKKIYNFNIFLEKKLFSKLINGSQNWNMSIGGSLIMFETFPNKFIPDIPFSLNFLRI